MAKAQNFFGGTSRKNPSANDPTLNQVGHSSAGNSPNTNMATTKTGFVDKKTKLTNPTIKGHTTGKVGQ